MRRGTWPLALALAVLVACAGEISTPGEPLRLLAPSLPAAFESEPYDATLRPTGGLRPYAYDVVEGSLPPGLRLEAGRIVGTPSVQGRFAFTVELSDANLNRTVQRLELNVRPLPEPVVGVDVPQTELQRPTTLRLRLESGRGWRGAEVLLTWDAQAFELDADSVRSIGRDVVAVWESEPGRLRVDVAALREPLSRATDLLSFTLDPVEPRRLGLDLTVASEAAAGRSLDTRRLGAPPEAVPEEPRDEETEEPVGEEDEEAVGEETDGPQDESEDSDDSLGDPPGDEPTEAPPPEEEP